MFAAAKAHLMKVFKFGSWRTGKGPFLGMALERHEDGSITLGNEEGVFKISSSTGQLQVAKAERYREILLERMGPILLAF